jgi:hypothetical protein
VTPWELEWATTCHKMVRPRPPWPIRPEPAVCPEGGSSQSWADICVFSLMHWDICESSEPWGRCEWVCTEPCSIDVEPHDYD